MDIRELQQKVVSTALQVGKVALGALYPNEFDVYMLTLELADSEDMTLQYFTFPVNPESISKSQPTVKSIDRTMGAIVINKTDMFVPQELTIKGNFGRAFKFVTRDKNFSTFIGSLSGFLPNKTEFNHYIKSGYGCFKILQDICEESEKLDEGNKPRRLYLYNPALGENYLVEVINFQASQSVGQNMLWGYDLRLKIVSPVIRKPSLKDMVSSVLTTAVVTEILGGAKKLLATLNYGNILRPDQMVADNYLRLKRGSKQLTFHVNQLVNLGDIIVDYYRGLFDDGLYPKEAFVALSEAESAVKYALQEVSNSPKQTQSVFEQVDALESCLSDIRTLRNAVRWLKSSIDKEGKVGSEAELEMHLKQNQTLESLSKDLGFADADGNALKIGLRNRIKETDYDIEGGRSLNVAPANNNNLKPNSVVDIMVGENVLGKDLQRKLTFADDDLAVLSPKDTFVQTCEIFTGLTKNCNPEFPDDGFDKTTICNKNLMNSRLSTFLRQMSAVVGRDDTIANFSLANVEMEGDVVRVDMEFESNLKNGETIRGSVYGN